MSSNFPFRRSLSSRNNMKYNGKISCAYVSQKDSLVSTENNSNRPAIFTKNQRQLNHDIGITNDHFLTNEKHDADNVRYSMSVYDGALLNREIKNIRDKTNQSITTTGSDNYNKIPIDELNDLRTYFQEKIRALNRYVKLLKERIEHVNDKCKKVSPQRIDEIERRLNEAVGFKKRRYRSVENSSRSNTGNEAIMFGNCIDSHKAAMMANHEFKQTIFDKIDILDKKLNNIVHATRNNGSDMVNKDYGNVISVSDRLNAMKEELNSFRARVNAQLESLNEKKQSYSVSSGGSRSRNISPERQYQSLIDSKIKVFASKLDELCNDKINYTLETIQENTDKLKNSVINFGIDCETDKCKKYPICSSFNGKICDEFSLLKNEIDLLSNQQKISATETINFVSDSVLETNNNVNKLKIDISCFNHQIETLKLDFTLMQKEIDFVKNQLSESGNSRKSDLNYTSPTDEFERLRNNVSSYKYTLDQHSDSLHNIYSQIKTISNDLLQVKNQVESLKVYSPSSTNHLSDNEVDLSKILSDISTLKESFKSVQILQINYKAMVNDILLLKSQNDDFKSGKISRFEQINEEISKLRTHFEEIEVVFDNIRNMSADISYLHTQVNTINESLSNVDSLSRDILDIKSNLRETSDTTAITKNITTLTSNFEIIREKLEFKLDQSSSKIDDVVTQLKDTYDGMEILHSNIKNLTNDVNMLKNQATPKAMENTTNDNGNESNLCLKLSEEINSMKELIKEIQKAQSESNRHQVNIQSSRNPVTSDHLNRDLPELTVESYLENNMEQDLSEIPSELERLKEQIKETSQMIANVKLDILNTKNELISYTDQKIADLFYRFNSLLAEASCKSNEVFKTRYNEQIESDKATDIFINTTYDQIKTTYITQKPKIEYKSENALESGCDLGYGRPIEFISNSELSGECYTTSEHAEGCGFKPMIGDIHDAPNTYNITGSPYPDCLNQ